MEKKNVMFPDHVGKQMKQVRETRPDIIVSVPVGDGSMPKAAEITKIVDVPVEEIGIEEKPKAKKQEVAPKSNYLHTDAPLNNDVKMSFYAPKETVQLKVMRTDPFAYLPEKKTRGAAAFDIFALEDCELFFGHVIKVRTGLAFEVPIGYKLEVYSRGGWASKGIFVVNQPGKIDCDFRGEVFVLLGKCQDDKMPTKIKKGNRIAQIELQEVVDTKIVAVMELSETERGDGAFGSTGM